MPYCQQFKQKIEEFKEKIQELKELLFQYKERGDEKFLRGIDREIPLFYQKIEEFKREYFPKVKALIEIYDIDSRLIPYLEFDNQGRGIVNRDVNVSDRATPLHFHFPHLIKTIEGDASFRQTALSAIDGLEEVKGVLNCAYLLSLESMKRLKKVGKGAIFLNTRIKALPELLEVGEELNISEIFTLKTPADFRQVFPRLNKIGARGGVSLILSLEQSSLQPYLEELQDRGELIFEGKIYIRD